MNLQRPLIAAMGFLAAITLAACGQHDATAPSREAFETGLRGYLADGHDQLCLAMYDWPIDLTEAEAGAGARRAVQLPVFEKLGLATSTIVSVPRSAENPDGAIKRYALTDEGRKYFKAHANKGRDGTLHQNDFCVARISLDHVDGWQLDSRDPRHPVATVSYSYRIDPAPWLQQPDAQRVLPMVAKVIKGAGGGLQMHQGFALQQQGWVPVSGPV